LFWWEVSVPARDRFFSPARRVWPRWPIDPSWNICWPNCVSTVFGVLCCASATGDPKFRVISTKERKWGLELRYSIEEELLGNAGAVKKAARMIDAPVLFVFNGDSLVGLDVQAMLDFHHSRRALATVALVASNRTSRYRRVLMDGKGAITSFRDQHTNSSANERGNRLVNTGAYLLSRQFVDSIPDERPVSMEDEMLPKLIGSGLYGFVTNGLFLDIGVPDDLARAQHELPMRWKV